MQKSEYPPDEVDLEKVKTLFFDISNGYGSAELRSVVEDLAKAHGKLLTLLHRHGGGEALDRRDIDAEFSGPRGYGQMEDAMRAALEAVFDHGENTKRRFLDAVKTVGLDYRDHSGCDDEDLDEFACTYFNKFSDVLAKSYVNDYQMKRVLGEASGRFS